jgi:hypothetical protein
LIVVVGKVVAFCCATSHTMGLILVQSVSGGQQSSVVLLASVMQVLLAGQQKEEGKPELAQKEKVDGQAEAD